MTRLYSFVKVCELGGDFVCMSVSNQTQIVFDIVLLVSLITVWLAETSTAEVFKKEIKHYLAGWVWLSLVGFGWVWPKLLSCCFFVSLLGFTEELQHSTQYWVEYQC